MRFSAVLLPLLAVAQGAVADPQQAQFGIIPPGLQPLINKANTLLATGQFNDAARTYSEAIEQSPADYLLYYKRATAYLSLQRHPLALQDFQHVLTLTSAPPPAVHLQIARIYAKNGQFASARSATRTYSAIAGGSGSSEKDANDLLFRIGEAEMAWKKAEGAKRAGLWTACVEAASLALQVATHSPEVRETRAECGVAGGDIELAVGDLGRLSHLTSASTPGFIRMFRLSYFFLPLSSISSSTPGTQSAAMTTLKQCLYYDPDSKPCLVAHRLVKQFDKQFTKLEGLTQGEDWKGVVRLVFGTGVGEDGLLAKFEHAAREHAAPELLRARGAATSGKLALPVPAAATQSPRLAHLLHALCAAHTKLGRPRDGAPYCERVLAMELEAPNFGDGFAERVEADALWGKGEALLADEEWEEAVRVLDRAFERSGRANREIHGRLQRAQKLLKQSRQKDYYKVLSVARDADAKTIKKAYRKATMKAHPDKGGSEAKMAAVNEAYEVLQNPELRARFDNGDDPNDPMAQQGGFGGQGGFPGGHPFAQFFQQGQPGGGGGFQFHQAPPGSHGRGSGGQRHGGFGFGH